MFCQVSKSSILIINEQYCTVMAIPNEGFPRVCRKYGQQLFHTARCLQRLVDSCAHELFNAR